jgi:hypothetical protein
MALLSVRTRPVAELLLGPEDYRVDPPSTDLSVWVVTFGRGSGLAGSATIVVVDVLDGTVYSVTNWRS